MCFVDSRAESRTSRVGKDLEKKMDNNKIDLEKKIDRLETKMDNNKIDLEKKMDRLETKMDRNQENIMNILLALSTDVAFIKGADSKKK